MAAEVPATGPVAVVVTLIRSRPRRPRVDTIALLKYQIPAQGEWWGSEGEELFQRFSFWLGTHGLPRLRTSGVFPSNQAPTSPPPAARGPAPYPDGETRPVGYLLGTPAYRNLAHFFQDHPISAQCEVSYRTDQYLAMSHVASKFHHSPTHARMPP